MTTFVVKANSRLFWEILAYPARWRSAGIDFGTPLVPVVPVSFRLWTDSHFFSAVTVLGTPQDVTLQELRIEYFFPLDEATAAAARRLE